MATLACNKKESRKTPKSPGCSQSELSSDEAELDGAATGPSSSPCGDGGDERRSTSVMAVVK